MEFEMHDFGRAISINELKVGDLYALGIDGTPALCLRAEDETSAFDVVLSSTKPIMETATTPCWVQMGAFSTGPFALLDGKLVIRPIFDPAGIAVAPPQREIEPGMLVIDGDRKAFVAVALDQRHPFRGYFLIELTSGRMANAKEPILAFKHWEIVRLDHKGTANRLATFPPASPPSI